MKKLKIALIKLVALAAILLMSFMPAFAGELQKEIVQFNDHLKQLDKDKKKKDPVSPEVLWEKWIDIAPEINALLGREVEIINKLNQEYEQKVIPISEQFTAGEITLDEFNEKTKDLREPYFETINTYQQFFKACHTLKDVHNNMDPESLKDDAVKFFYYESAFETIAETAKMIKKEKIPIKL